MKLQWLRVAATETREARLYYKQEAEGLGSRFVDELRSTLDRIQAFPLAWPQCESEVRRALVNRFPYLVHYVIEDDTIIIIGVYHARRRPISWRARLGRGA